MGNKAHEREGCNLIAFARVADWTFNTLMFLQYLL